MLALPAKFQPFAKPLLVGAAVLLLGAPTAGAVMKTAMSAPVQAVSNGALLRIELVAPAEPEVQPVYPLETFEVAPIDEFKAGPQRGRAWRVGFDFDLDRQIQEAEPQGQGESIPYDPPPMAWSREPERRASYEETVSRWGPSLILPEGE